MNRLKNEAIILSREATNHLLNSLINPNKAAIAKREAFLSDMSQIDIAEKDNGEVTLDVPWLDLSKNNLVNNNQLDTIIHDCLKQMQDLKGDCFVTRSNITIENKMVFQSKFYRMGVSKEITIRYDNATNNSWINNKLINAA